ncbi:MAG: PilT/PilU family type 4a pilus ATPase [Polyangiales bacterium]
MSQEDQRRPSRPAQLGRLNVREEVATRPQRPVVVEEVARPARPPRDPLNDEAPGTRPSRPPVAEEVLGRPQRERTSAVSEEVLGRPQRPAKPSLKDEIAARPSRPRVEDEEEVPPRGSRPSFSPPARPDRVEAEARAFFSEEVPVRGSRPSFNEDEILGPRFAPFVQRRGDPRPRRAASRARGGGAAARRSRSGRRGVALARGPRRDRRGGLHARTPRVGPHRSAAAPRGHRRRRRLRHLRHALVAPARESPGPGRPRRVSAARPEEHRPARGPALRPPSREVPAVDDAPRHRAPLGAEDLAALREQIRAEVLAALPAAATEKRLSTKPDLPTTAPGTPGKNRVDRFLKLMNDRGASDLHLSSGRPPIFRLGGRMEPIRYRTLSDGDFKALLEPITPQHLWREYLDGGDADFAYELPGVCRFRVNMFKQARGMGAVFRIIPTRLMTVQQLGLPDSIRKVVEMRSGLVLVTGPTGSGKSTTLSAIINEMNETREMHFVTIEDPIEFVHPNKQSLMSQREIGPHSKSFSSALRAAVREDPDAILVGEMRDLETISMALSAAETGVLVFGTLHTNSAAKTIDRVINVFPAEKQPGVRGTLASVTRCVVAQQLLRKKGGGRVAAVEILFGSHAMASMIRDGKTHQISGLIKLGKKDGMIAMDDALKALVEEGTIEPVAGLEKSLDKDDFRKWLKSRGEDVPEDSAH